MAHRLGSSASGTEHSGLALTEQIIRAVSVR